MMGISFHSQSVHGVHGVCSARASAAGSETWHLGSGKWEFK